MPPRKWLSFVLFGLAGGCAGTLAGGLAPGFARDAGLAEICFKTGSWSALAGGVLAVALFWANDHDRRRKPTLASVLAGLCSGLGGGLIAGALAELLFQQLAQSDSVSVLIYATAWSLLGLMLGLALSRKVPNMGFLRGAVSGLLGGGLGGAGFAALLATDFMPEFLARMTGLGLLGAALGLAIVVVNQLFREAALEVVWAPGEHTFFNLGVDPIRIGGGKDDEIFVRGLNADFARITFDQGLINYVDLQSGHSTPLKNASTLQIGSLQLIIHAGA